MNKTEVVLSVFHNGQFFAALFERSDDAGYSVCQRLFAAEPSDAEILSFILEGYYSLAFGKPVYDRSAAAIPAASNPKRRQREAAKLSKNVGASTKAQQAMKRQQEDAKEHSRSAKASDRKLDADLKYSLRAAKKKKKHKGR